MVLLFDGVCNLCEAWVRFILPRDRRSLLRFARLQSETANRILQPTGLSGQDLKTMVLVEEGRCYTKSDAALRIIKRLDGAWPLLYALIVIPRPLRDLVYDWIARNRYRWFGKKERCLVPSPEMKKRFLD